MDTLTVVLEQPERLVLSHLELTPPGEEDVRRRRRTLLYFFDPHSWYNPPSPYDQAYDPGYTGTLALPGNFRDGQAGVAGTSVLAPEDVAHVLALYDGEISYWDNQLGEVLTALQTQQILDNALLVVTSDHGDMFGEHGKWNHTNCLYEELLRVPLLMRYSGVITPGQVINTPVHNMDVMPTLLDYAGLPIPADLQAVSLRSLIEGGMATPRYLFCELAWSRRSGQRAARAAWR